VCALSWDRDELYRRAEQRVQREIDAGLVDEVRAVLARGISRTARQALGVKEMAAFVEGELSVEEAKELLVRNTKNFVRKQLSWFAADPRVEWVNASQLGWDDARRTIVERFRTTG
jgi:tRNA dimethylallyltransferase